MKCPKCNSTQTIKNGHRRGKQCYQCRACGRQFVEEPKIQPYPAQVKELCLKMYLNGMGLREIERVTEIHHTTIINWIRQTGISQTGIRIKLSNSQKAKKISERNEIDDLHAFLRHFFISLSPIKNYLNSYLNRYNSAISSFFI